MSTDKNVDFFFLFMEQNISIKLEKIIYAIFEITLKKSAAAHQPAGIFILLAPVQIRLRQLVKKFLHTTNINDVCNLLKSLALSRVH